MTFVPASHFESLEQQAHAARFGTLLLLASEVLLFAGLFALWASYRAEHAVAFAEATRETDAALGLVNTLVLLAASFVVALAVHAQRLGHWRAARSELAVGAVLGVVFLVIKATEWRDHLEHGIEPGGRLAHGPQVFWTLYYAATGLHAIHVAVGVAVLAACAWIVGRGGFAGDRTYVLDNCIAYWHLVDAIWLLLWPMFYLIRHAP